jgi:serine protease Do
MTRSNLSPQRIAVALTALSAFCSLPVSAQEPTGIEAAAAVENVMVKAIAAAERSVVAIARVSRADNDRIDALTDPFNRLRPMQSPRPGDPEFIPNDYATGVVVGPGQILTAYHVLHDDSDYWVATAGGKTHKARVRAADPRSDLAVLEIESRDLAPIKFGDSTKLKKGQIVIALGNPYAIARDGDVSASWGIVSNLRRKDGPSAPARDERPGPARYTLHQFGTLIQTDARLNLGTSGGALVNLKGEMIGLTISLAAALGYEQAAGFAIPVDETFLRALDALKQGNEVEYGFLGISMPQPGDPVARATTGAVVSQALEGTPAGRAQLRPGDVIIRVNEFPVHEPDDLLLHVGELAPDSSVRLTVVRDGQPQMIVIPELAKYGVSRKQVITNRPPAWRGLRVDYITVAPEVLTLSDQRRIDPQGSVLITEVEPDSPAWKEGLRADMMISHVDNRRVSTPKEFREAVANKGGPVQLRLSPSPDDRAVRTIPPAAS